MRKKVAFVVLGLTAATVLGSMSGARAGCDQGGPSAGHSEQVILPGPGTHVYTDGRAPGSTSGYAGLHGGTGYVEAGGDATTPSGSIQGSTTDGAVDGKISVNSSGPHVCINDTVYI